MEHRERWLSACIAVVIAAALLALVVRPVSGRVQHIRTGGGTLSASNVTNSPVDDHEPSVAVDPNDPNHIAVGWMRTVRGNTVQGYLADCWESVSRDGGATWSGLQLLG